MLEERRNLNIVVRLVCGAVVSKRSRIPLQMYSNDNRNHRQPTQVFLDSCACGKRAAVVCSVCECVCVCVAESVLLLSLSERCWSRYGVSDDEYSLADLIIIIIRDSSNKMNTRS